MKLEIDFIQKNAEHVQEIVKTQEPGLRRLDKGLADKVKKMGEAAGEVSKHIKERRGPATG